MRFLIQRSSIGGYIVIDAVTGVTVGAAFTKWGARRVARLQKEYVERLERFKRETEVYEV